MPQKTRTCASCRNIDLPNVILRSGLTESYLRGLEFSHAALLKTQERSWSCESSFLEQALRIVKEGSCSRCNLLTRALRTILDDMDTEGLFEYCQLSIRSIPHPVLADYNATYLTLG
jgi:hypothetical protein